MDQKYINDKSGNHVLPITHENSVRDSQGTPLSTKLDIINGSLLEEKDYAPASYSGMGRKVLPKNMVNGVNTLTQAMMPVATGGNTVYVIQYDYVLGEDITVPANCVLEFDGGSISTHVITVNKTNILGCPRFINVTLRGTIINTVIKSEWFNTLDNFATSCSNTRGYKNIYVKEGTYSLTVPFLLDGDLDINFNNSIINVADLNPFLSYNQDKTEELITTLSAEANVGDRSINVNDATGLKRGDLLILRDETSGSYNTYRSGTYKQGEFIMVYDINGNTINLISPLYGTYLTANLSNCKLYKLDFNTCNIRNVRINNNKTAGNKEQYCFKLKNNINAVIDNIIINGYDINIAINYSYHISVKNCEITSPFPDSIYDPSISRDRVLDQYGVLLGSSQNITVEDITGSCGNHVCSIVGGTFPTRNVIYRRIFSRSVHEGYCGLNAHGSAEYITIENSNLPGIEIGGDYYTIRNCIITECFYQKNNVTYNYAVAIGENVGYNILIDNCQIYGAIIDRDDVSFGGLISKTNDFIITNTKFKRFDNSVPCSKLNILGTYNIIIDNCIFDGDPAKTSNHETIEFRGIATNIITNCIVKNTGITKRSNSYFMLKNNDIDVTYGLLYIPAAINNVEYFGIIGNNITIDQQNTSYRCIDIYCTTEDAINTLDISNNYIFSNGMTPISMENKNAIKNLIFKGNITNQNSSYIQMKCKRAFVDDTPELGGSTNHILIVADTITKGKDLVPQS